MHIVGLHLLFKMTNKKQYFNALETEFHVCYKGNYIVKTIYIGGGTPSSVTPKFIEQVLDRINYKFKVDKNAEIQLMQPNQR
jgi:oxygen-independent coproporphyrinogen-3 oxidase